MHTIHFFDKKHEKCCGNKNLALFLLRFFKEYWAMV